MSCIDEAAVVAEEVAASALRSRSAWIARPHFQICGLWAKANAAAVGQEEQEAPSVRKVKRVLLQRCQSEESNGCAASSGRREGGSPVPFCQI